jgi:hypothetical protein
MTDRISEAIAESLEHIRNGKSVEQCLALFPDLAEELEPLLKTAIATQDEFANPMPSQARSKIRGAVLDEWDARESRQGWWNAFLVPRRAAATALVLVLVVVGGIAPLAASASAMPGDVLYLVKELRENTQLWFTRSPEAKVDLYTRFVRVRVDELQTLANRDAAHADNISQAVLRLGDQLSSLDHEVSEAVESSSEVGGVASSFVQTVADAATEQDAARIALQGTLGSASIGAQPDLKRAILILSDARSRVSAALESMAQSEQDK